jgi:CheY-like chemotaxis protein
LSKLVVVVDDEKDIAEIISDLLTPEKIRTVCAYDGKTGLELILKQLPDAVVIDVKMPGMSGLEVIEQMRQNPKLKKIPVVVITATQVIRESEVQYKHLNVLQWISKPFEPDELLATLLKAIGKK